MTGTPSTRSDKEEILFKAGLRKVVYRLSIEEAVSLEIISDFKITVVAVDLDNRLGTTVDYGNRSERDVYELLDKRAVKSYQNGSIPYEIIERANFIKKSQTKLKLAKHVLDKYCADSRTLVFSPYIDIAKELCEHNYHSKSNSKESLEKFQSQEINRLSLVNAGGVGFTYEGVENVVLMQMDSNKTGLSTQKIARSLLRQGDKQVNVYVLVLDETQDVVWVNTALASFDRNRVSVIRIDL
jgi:superfamily II DNA or RNA helicase